MDDGSLKTIIVHLFSTDNYLAKDRNWVQQCQDLESTIPLGFAKYDLLIIEQKTSNGELFTTLAEHGPVI